ncbi:hypothetical protein BLA29_013450, partial [Euroglyphus maynei]
MFMAIILMICPIFGQQQQQSTTSATTTLKSTIVNKQNELPTPIMMKLITKRSTQPFGSSFRCLSICRRNEENLCKRCLFREPMRFGKRNSMRSSSSALLFREPMRFGKKRADFRQPMRFGKKSNNGNFREMMRFGRQ